MAIETRRGIRTKRIHLLPSLAGNCSGCHLHEHLSNLHSKRLQLLQRQKRRCWVDPWESDFYGRTLHHTLPPPFRASYGRCRQEVPHKYWLGACWCEHRTHTLRKCHSVSYSLHTQVRFNFMNGFRVLVATGIVCALNSPLLADYIWPNSHGLANSYVFPIY